MRLRVTTFSGIAPGISPRLLSEQFGQVAENIDFESGVLVPIDGDTDAFTLQNNLRNSIFKYRDTHWLEWAEDDVYVTEGPIANDAYDRIYWTGAGTYPEMGTQTVMITGASGYPASSYRLGIPAPTAAPTVDKTGTADPDQIPNSVSYVYTLVSVYGEEGPPSDPSTPVDLTDTEAVDVSLSAFSVPSGNYNFGAGALKRIYRSNTGSATTEFQFVGEVSIAAITFNDALPYEGLGEVMPSYYWIGPPDDNASLYPDGPMQGLTNVANGIMAGFAGKQLCLSEPYLPHAWPAQYRKTLEDTIVAIKPTANGVICLTTGRPVFVTGVDPSAMSSVKIDLAQACVNPRGAVDMGDYTLYPGPDGLCQVSSAGGEVVTKGVISRDQWNTDFHPDILYAFKYKGAYVAFWDTGNAYGGWIMDASNPKSAISTITGAEIRGGWVNPRDGELYTIVANKIKRHRADGTALTARWKSKEFVTPYPITMGWVAVIAEAYPCTVKVIVDGAQIADYTISKSGSVYTQVTTTPTSISNASLKEPIMRLPSVLGCVWEVEISSTKTVNEVILAQSMSEIREV